VRQVIEGGRVPQVASSLERGVHFPGQFTLHFAWKVRCLPFSASQQDERF
jgi:hypothetical protein